MSNNRSGIHLVWCYRGLALTKLLDSCVVPRRPPGRTGFDCVSAAVVIRVRHANVQSDGTLSPLPLRVPSVEFL